MAENSDGLALFATDFHTDTAGYVRVLVIDRGLGAERAGAQRIVELETYRTQRASADSPINRLRRS